jgi:hypothetical protein
MERYEFEARHRSTIAYYDGLLASLTQAYCEVRDLADDAMSRLHQTLAMVEAVQGGLDQDTLGRSTGSASAGLNASMDAERDRLARALAMIRSTATSSPLRPRAGTRTGGAGRGKSGGGDGRSIVINVNELDPKYRNIAWLVSTRWWSDSTTCTAPWWRSRSTWTARSASTASSWGASSHGLRRCTSGCRRACSRWK